MINLRGDVKDITKHLDKTQRWVIPQAVPAAINKTAGQVNTQVRREISKKLGIPQKHFKSRIKLYRATRRNWSSKNWIGLKTKIPVSKVYKSNSRQISYAKGKLNIPGNKLFGAKMPKSGHEGVYYRKGSKRLPIQEVMIDLSDVAPDTLLRLGRSITTTKFKNLLRHELQWRLNRKAV